MHFQFFHPFSYCGCFRFWEFYRKYKKKYTASVDRSQSQGDLYQKYPKESVLRIKRKKDSRLGLELWSFGTDSQALWLITNSNHMQSPIRFFAFRFVTISSSPSPLLSSTHFGSVQWPGIESIVRWGCRLSINHQIKNY